MKSSLKTTLAKELGVSRGSLYYKSKQEEKDWKVKCLIEEALRDNPSYGHKRLAPHLHMNKKRILRVMKKYGIKPYRRRGKKWKNTKGISETFPNLLLSNSPSYPNRIWTSDFTYLSFKNKTVYVATVMDLWNKKIVGLSVLTNHSVQLTINALLATLNANQRPEIFHSDNGSEYDAKDFKIILKSLDIKISRSKPGCPWENGYQESFYGKFKIELGDPNRFKTLGELVSAIYQAIHYYNNNRIHTSLKMSPNQFALKYEIAKLNTSIMSV
jgi:transposase InsO family protein